MDTFKTITLRQYQALYAISKTDDQDKDMKLVAVLTGKTLAQVEDMRLDDYNRTCQEITRIFSVKPESNPKRSIRILGKRYGITYNPRKLTPGRYVEIQTWLKAGVIDNMDRIMASMVYPVNWLGRRIKGGLPHPELSEAIKDCRFIDVYSACVFFSLLWNRSIKALADSLVKESKMTEAQKRQVKKLLQTATDGFTMLSQ